jgi:hypothetical protein
LFLCKALAKFFVYWKPLLVQGIVSVVNIYEK